jgi:hypothetical protein
MAEIFNFINKENIENKPSATKSYNELQALAATKSTNKDDLQELYLAVRKEESKQTMKERETERRGLEKYYELRDKWSKYLIILLSVMIVFQNALVLMIGFEWLNFLEYKNFLYAAVIESFLQIAGMCGIVVVFLFPNSKYKKINNN